MTCSPTFSFIPESELVDEHRQWLRVCDQRHERKWERLLRADSEAAACEAAVRRFLASNGIAVFPNESLNGRRGGPDFRCERGGNCFLVEATCLRIETVTNRTGLPHLVEPGGRYLKSLNAALVSEIVNKAAQCSGSADPTLVAVGTFHEYASLACINDQFVRMLLTGEPVVRVEVNRPTGRRINGPIWTTDLWPSAFVGPHGDDSFKHNRKSVSGVLVCGFGVSPPRVRGILHPAPVRPLNRQLLPAVPFFRLRSDYEAGVFSAEAV